jgi:hypothetical protein
VEFVYSGLEFVEVKATFEHGFVDKVGEAHLFGQFEPDWAWRSIPELVFADISDLPGVMILFLYDCWLGFGFEL